MSALRTNYGAVGADRRLNHPVGTLVPVAKLGGCGVVDALLVSMTRAVTPPLAAGYLNNKNATTRA